MVTATLCGIGTECRTKARDFELVVKALNFEAHGFKRIKKCRRRDSNPYAKYLARDFKSLVSAIPPLRRGMRVLYQISQTSILTILRIRSQPSTMNTTTPATAARPVADVRNGIIILGLMTVIATPRTIGDTETTKP